jgi:hypothetical protein
LAYLLEELPVRTWAKHAFFFLFPSPFVLWLLVGLGYRNDVDKKDNDEDNGKDNGADNRGDKDKDKGKSHDNNNNNSRHRNRTTVPSRPCDA